MEAYAIRTYGDPVLRSSAQDVLDIDGKLVGTCERMFDAMTTAQGIGLAAPQVGIQKRFFVYDIELVEHPDAAKGAVLRSTEKKRKRTSADHKMGVILNPEIQDTEGEWAYEEACLSVPGLSWDIIRPKVIHISGLDLEGNEISLEADELFSRLIQHEIDHLDGVLLIDRLDEDARRDAKKALRDKLMQ